MRYTFRFGTYFGIPVKLHITFPLILIIFGLEAGIRGGWREAFWSVILVLSVFVCVVLHELGHSLQVKRYGIEVKDIVLLPIGGMARAVAIPEKPSEEIAVAITGPLVNFGLAALMLPLLLMRHAALDFEKDFLANLFSINLVLGTFNLIPAFPMDGGRILRGFLATRMSYLRATHHAKNVGQAIAVIFVVLGFAFSNLVMLPFIAVVIFFGAMSEENMVKAKVRLQGKVIGDFVRDDAPVLRLEDDTGTVAGLPTWGTSNLIAVTDREGRLAGAICKKDIPEAHSQLIGPEKLRSFLITDFPLMEASTPAIQAFHYLKAEKEPFVGIMDKGQFQGLVTLTDLLRMPSPD